jgi:hypothetical protein
MAEGVHLVADHLGNRAGRPHVEVAADDLHADRLTWLQRTSADARKVWSPARHAAHWCEAIVAKH